MNRFLFALVSVFSMLSCSSQKSSEPIVVEEEQETKTEKMEIQHLTYNDFINDIFNFEKSTGWEYKGDKPIIIDFYADWCQPCKQISPILAAIHEEYEGLIKVYKVNIDDEPELATACSVKSIPALLFIPTGDKEPVSSVGLIGKNDFRSIIKEVFDISRP